MRRPKIIADVTPDFVWNSKKIWNLHLPVEEIEVEKLLWHLDYPFWEKEGTDDWNLTLKEFLSDPKKEPSHYEKVKKADTSFPLEVIMYNSRYRILDGLHRFAKVLLNGDKKVKVRIIPPEHFKDIIS